MFYPSQCHFLHNEIENMKHKEDRCQTDDRRNLTNLLREERNAATMEAADCVSAKIRNQWNNESGDDRGD